MSGSSNIPLWLDDGTNLVPKNDRNILPETTDGAALGSDTVMWSDLFLADGGVVNWNNGNYTLTHSAGTLTANGIFQAGTLTDGTASLTGGALSGVTTLGMSGDLTNSAGNLIFSDHDATISASTSSGAGNSVTIAGADAASGDNDGGGIDIHGGAESGSGDPGDVQLGWDGTNNQDIVFGDDKFTINTSDNLFEQSGLNRTASSESVADDGTITLETGVAGILTVWTEAEYMQVYVDTAGVVSSIVGSINTAITDSDTDLCVYDGGTGAVIKNRLGATKTVRYIYNYS